MSDEKIIPKSRVFISKRDRAMRTMRMLNAADEKKTWLVGISSENIAMFDIEKYCSDALALAYFLKEKYTNSEVGIFQSDRGYHIVLKKILNEKEFLRLYEEVKKFAIENGFDLDYEHLNLSIKYKRTTLRITPKPFRENSKSPKLVMVI